MATLNIKASRCVFGASTRPSAPISPRTPTPSGWPRGSRRPGVNSVRLHHMDTSWWPERVVGPHRRRRDLRPQPWSGWTTSSTQLAQHGVCVNLNLHVGRVAQRLSRPARIRVRATTRSWGSSRPSSVTAQRSFADTLLNACERLPRRALRRRPRDSRSSRSPTKTASSCGMATRNAPRAAGVLRGHSCQGAIQRLAAVARYGSRSALDAAWAEGIEPLGDNLLSNGDFQEAGGGGFPQLWNLEQHGASTAAWTITQHQSVPCLRLDVANDDGVGWHLQINQGRTDRRRKPVLYADVRRRRHRRSQHRCERDASARSPGRTWVCIAMFR